MSVKVAPVTLDPITANAGDTIRFDIPNDYPVAIAELSVTGNLVVGTNPAQSLQNFGAVNVVKNFRVYAKGEQRMDVSGKIFYLDSFAMNGGISPLAQPVLTVGTNAFGCTFYRMFQMARLATPLNDRGIFPAHLIRDTQLIINVGTAADIAVAGAGGTVALSGVTFMLTLWQVIDTAPALNDPAFYVNEQIGSFGPDTALIAALASPSRDVKLNVDGKYRYIGLIVEDLSGTGGAIAPRDDLLNTVRIRGNRTEIVRQGFPALQRSNARQYQVEPSSIGIVSSDVPGWPSGVAFIDWTGLWTLLDLYDTAPLLSQGSDLFFNTDVIVAGTTAQITLFYSRILGL